MLIDFVLTLWCMKKFWFLIYCWNSRSNSRSTFLNKVVYWSNWFAFQWYSIVRNSYHKLENHSVPSYFSFEGVHSVQHIHHEINFLSEGCLQKKLMRRGHWSIQGEGGKKAPLFWGSSKRGHILMGGGVKIFMSHVPCSLFVSVSHNL